MTNERICSMSVLADMKENGEATLTANEKNWKKPLLSLLGMAGFALLVGFLSIITHEEIHRQAGLFFGYHPSQPTVQWDEFMAVTSFSTSELETMSSYELFVITFSPTIIWMLTAFLIGWPLLGRLAQRTHYLPQSFEENTIMKKIVILFSKRITWLVLIEFIVISQALKLEGGPNDLKLLLKYY
jgi:hypothetical protein